MNERINQYISGVFAPYETVKSVSELKTDLLADLEERFRELKAAGKDDEAAFEMTIESIGDMEQTVLEVANLSHTLERQLLINFSAQDLSRSDFAGVKLRGGKFESSAIKDANFAGADLTGSSFKSSDLRGANFDGANLTDCNFSTLDLSNASFRDSILVRTNFSKSGMSGVTFSRVKLTDVNFSMIALKSAIFESCVIDGGTFTYADLSGQRFDGMTIRNVHLGKACLQGASFQNATLQNVSFMPPFSLLNKYYKIIKSIQFSGATMDKLTYNALVGMGANLAGVNIL